MHFRRAERHDRFAGGQKPPGKVAVLSGTVLQTRAAMARRRTEEDCERGRSRYRGPGRPFDWRGLFSVPVDRGRSAFPGHAAGSGSVANRSVTCPTRLETRTKESNMCASQWVLRNLEAK